MGPATNPLTLEPTLQFELFYPAIGGPTSKRLSIKITSMKCTTAEEDTAAAVTIALLFAPIGLTQGVRFSCCAFS